MKWQKVFTGQADVKTKTASLVAVVDGSVVRQFYIAVVVAPLVGLRLAQSIKRASMQSESWNGAARMASFHHTPLVKIHLRSTKQMAEQQAEIDRAERELQQLKQQQQAR